MDSSTAACGPINAGHDVPSVDVEAPLVDMFSTTIKDAVSFDLRNSESAKHENSSELCHAMSRHVISFEEWATTRRISSECLFFALPDASPPNTVL